MTLRAVDDQRTRVTIQLSGAPAGPEPAHVHERSCDDIDPQPTDGLQPILDGRSETVINVSLDHLRSAAHAVNVHKSAGSLDDYVACGTIGEDGSLLP